MEAIKDIIVKANGFLEPYVAKIIDFLSKGYTLVYGVIVLFLAILVLAGLIAMLKKTPKLFAFIIILLGIVVAIWYFLYFKAAV